MITKLLLFLLLCKLKTDSSMTNQLLIKNLTITYWLFCLFEWWLIVPRDRFSQSHESQHDHDQHPFVNLNKSILISMHQASFSTSHSHSYGPIVPAPNPLVLLVRLHVLSPAEMSSFQLVKVYLILMMKHKLLDLKLKLYSNKLEDTKHDTKHCIQSINYLKYKLCNLIALDPLNESLMISLMLTKFLNFLSY